MKTLRIIPLLIPVALFCAHEGPKIPIHESLPMDLSYNTPTSYLCDTVSSHLPKAQEYNRLALELAGEGKLDAAISNYIKAIESDTYFAEPWSNIAVVYWRKGLPNNARLTLHHALALNPHLAEAHNNLGTLLLHDKQYAQAEKALKTAVQLRPEYEKAYLNLVRLYLEQNQEERAWECQKAAAEFNPENEITHSILGQLSLKLKKYGDAATAFEQAVELGDERHETLSNLAYAYFMNGQTEKAVQIYDKLAHTDQPAQARKYNK